MTKRKPLDPHTLRVVARLVREGREVPDPLDDCRSTVMVDWDDMDKLAKAILRLGKAAA